MTQTVTRSRWTGGPVHGVKASGCHLPSWRHAHAVPGVWDGDNGWAAGLLCHQCWTDGRACSLEAAIAAEEVR